MTNPASHATVDPSAPTILPPAPTPPSTPAAPRTESAVVRETPGNWIGPYKLIQVIGEGGFGSVFMAEQERPVQRKVALKIIKLGMDTMQVMARFEAERQALAMMDHPSIAKVFDAGATETGRPYFVMEFCQGDSMTDYCEQAKLSIPDRLNLFIQVCQAVQHAHTKGIIHRDIKPSNVLITNQDGKALPKVIDFGIAKATASKLTDRTYFTEHRQLIGTPEYMSPEQAEGSLDIDTRTDVYSLGVLLYELLTGTTPLESRTLRSADYGDISRIIREVEPPKPSLRLSAITMAPARKNGHSSVAAPAPALPSDRKSRAFRRELDWIVMKALEKDRLRRYDSASEFASDLQRYIKNEPVIAAPASKAYRIKKFVVRHKFGVTAAALVALALALGITATTASLVRAVRAERVAAREAKTSGEALQFLVGLFAVNDPSEAQGNTITAMEILDKGAQRIRTELADQPESQATLMATMGIVYRSLGAYRKAEPLLKDALAQRRALTTKPDPKIADTLNDLAKLWVIKGEFGPAENLYDEALAIYRAAYGEEHASIAQSLNDKAFLLTKKGDLKGADAMYRKALDMRKRLLVPETKAIADSTHNLAMNIFDQGDADTALPLLGDALTIRKKLFGRVHPDVVESLSGLGNVLYTQGKYDLAIPYFRESLDVQKKLVFDADHPDVAMAMNNLAFVLHDSGDLSGAETMYRDVLEMQRRLFRDADGKPTDHPEIAQVLNNLAAVLHDKKELSEAEKTARESLDMYRRIHQGKEHIDIAQGLNNLARWIQEKGDLPEAESMFREALAMRRKLLGDKHRSVAISMTGLANVIVEQRKYEDGLAKAAEARDACIGAFPEGHWRIAVARGVEGAALAGLGRYQEAEPLLTESYKNLQTDKGAAMYLGDARQRLFTMYTAWNKPESAAIYRPTDPELPRNGP
jgi:eukaryotic-like serine/threonine-protein kinase